MKNGSSPSRMVDLSRWFAPVFTMLFLLVWQIASDRKLISDLFFPAPLFILKTLWRMTISGEMFENLGASVGRLSLGVLAGLIPGVILGLAMGWSRKIRIALDPFIAILNPIPKLAIFPLIMIVLGLGESSKIFVVALSTFFPMLINSVAGVRQLNPVYFEVAKNYGANRFKTFTRVVFPGSLPLILAGFRISFSLALVMTIAVELLTANKGLGVLIWFSWQTLRTEELYATLVVISILGYLINYLLIKISYWLTPWYFKSKKDVA
jgi:ABC-type nitrate/sulfonate/bicarbonate transport system permease component